MPDGSLFPAEAVAGGTASELRLRPGCRRAAPPAWLIEPASRDTGAPPLVIVHGITRNAAEIAERMAARAHKTGRTIVAPLFAAPTFKGYQRLFGGRRADLALIALLDALIDEGRIPAGPVELAGFSGGAQFAHRFAWLYPHRLGRLTLAAPGWWTFPDTAPYPYGLGRSTEGPSDAPRWMQANLADFLNRDITVAVGSDDCRPDSQTRSGPAIDAQQGPDRLTRARRWAAAATATAERLGLSPRIALHTLPGAGHDFRACADAGLDHLLLPTP